MLKTLSDNWDLKDYIKEAGAMLTQVVVQGSPSFELGVEKGLEQGMERGAHRERLRMGESLLGLLPDAFMAEKTALALETVRGLRSGQD